MAATRTEFVLFLHGKYRSSHADYYKKLCRGRITVAVDAGYRFFEKAGIAPDVLLGDFDSLRKLPESLPRRTKVVAHPPRKDKTDSHLAIEYAIERGASAIDIVQPDLGEPDHFTCNLMLLPVFGAMGRRRAPQVRLVNTRCEVWFVADRSVEFTDSVGDRVSVIPHCEGIEYTCSGTAYDVEKLAVSPGQTVAARNMIERRKAVFSVKGRAWLFRLFARGHRRA